MKNKLLNFLLGNFGISLTYFYFRMASLITNRIDLSRDGINMLSFVLIGGYIVIALPAILVALKKMKEIIE